MIFVRNQSFLLQRSLLVLACLLLFNTKQLLAQAVQGNVEAIAAEPYGVARLIIPAGQLATTTTLRIVVSDSSDRVMFPAIDFVTSEPPEVHSAQTGDRQRLGNGALIGRIRSAIQNAKEQIDPPELIRVHFLFRGSDPFVVRLSGDLEATIDVRPIKLPDPIVASEKQKQNSPNLAQSPQFQALIRSWWNGYVQQAKRQIERSDYPAIVESYLTHMLAYRYGFELPDVFKKSATKRKQTDPLPTIALVAGVEELRAELFQESLRKSPPLSLKLVPTPEPPKWLDSVVPYTPENLVIEPIAKMVPPECYYLRFASFSNYLWFQSLSQTRGGDLAQMAVAIGDIGVARMKIERADWLVKSNLRQAAIGNRGFQLGHTGFVDSRLIAQLVSDLLQLLSLIAEVYRFPAFGGTGRFGRGIQRRGGAVFGGFLGVAGTRTARK